MTSRIPYLLTEKEAARRLTVSTRSLQRWRTKGVGPNFRKFGGLVRYTEEDLERFIVESFRTSTKE
jgi:DNA-binding transcriptional MerR regulator